MERLSFWSAFWNGSLLASDRQDQFALNTLQMGSLDDLVHTEKLFISLSDSASLYFSLSVTRTSLFLVSMPFDGVCLPARLPLAMVPSWKAPRHTHLARRLPLWSASPFVSTMLMKALSVSTARTPGRLLMSSLFDRYRHPARTMLFFFFIPHGRSSFALVYACMFTEVCVCGAKGVGDKKEGAGQLIRTSL